MRWHEWRSVEMDWKNPDYTEILRKRQERLLKLRKRPELLQAAKIHYAHHPWDFVNDWGMTFDPRNIERGLPALIPFVLFPRQVEFLKWLYEQWKGGERGLVEKSRDFGATWLGGAFSVAMWLFRPGFTAGFGSRKEELVDKKGDPKCIFEKIRPFIRYLPKEFRPAGYDEREHATFMKIINPENGATITGESGDEIGRGGRMSVYFVDEAAFIQRQEKVDAALSQTTNCQVDISTPNGNGNAFYKKRNSGKVDVFVMDWKDDPRKNHWEHEDGRTGQGNDAPEGALYPWYEKQKGSLDEVIIAQEIDRDYNASQENVFIPSKWVEACVDAHKKLGWEGTGQKVVSFDPADVGDAKAWGMRHGSLVCSAHQKKSGDITHVVPEVKKFVSDMNPDAFVYDSDGMGAPIIKLAIKDEFEHRGLACTPFMGAGTNFPNAHEVIPELDKKPADAFLNMRAWGWWNLRNRCEKTYNRIVNNLYANVDEMISFSSDIEDLDTLKAELSRPMRQFTGNGKIKCESKADMKQKRGVASPNMADQVMMEFANPQLSEEEVGEIEFLSEWG